MWDRPKGRHKHHGIEYETYDHPRYKYRLVRDHRFKLGFLPRPFSSDYVRVLADGTCILYIGYAWDGPSGPTIDTKNFMRPSLEHDARYQILRSVYSKLKEYFGAKAAKRVVERHRLTADEHLKRACLMDGMSRFRAWYVFHAVRIFGRFALFNPKMF